MRKRASSGGVTVQGIAGTHAIFFGLDLDPGVLPGCLGFAVHRQDHTESEEYWLSGFKTFRSIVPNPDPTQFYSSYDHPIQSFYRTRFRCRSRAGWRIRYRHAEQESAERLGRSWRSNWWSPVRPPRPLLMASPAVQ